MKTNQLKFLSIALLASTNIFAQPVFAQSADAESNFYKPTIGSARETLNDEPGQDDSDRLSNLIQEVADQGGGIVTIGSGTHYFKDVNMMSNVHIRVKKDATLKPVYSDTYKPDKNVTMFLFGDSENTINNVSIEGTSNTSRAKIDMSKLGGGGVKAIRLANVKNFQVANFDIKDKDTRLASITLNMFESKSGNKAPKDGVVKNIDMENAAYGYGLIQLQSATHVLFKNLYGDGGITLRLESGASDDSPNPVITDRIYGRNIRGKDCSAAVMTSPHELQQGRFDIQDVTSDGCGFAVRIEAGFKTVTPNGTYKSSSILRNVKAKFGTNAQLKSKHFEYLPCALQDEPVKDDTAPGENDTYIGPSVSAVGYTSNYKIDFRDSDVQKADGFVEAAELGTDKVVRDKDIKNLTCKS